jgi:iron complex outermembrane receptor protein
MKSLLLLTAACLMLTVSSFAQFKISGTVSDETQTLAGANVILKNTYKATTTNTNGNYVFNKLKAGEYMLVVSFIGYETQEIVIQLSVDTELNITLKKTHRCIG